jgi:hypothetical protein
MLQVAMRCNTVRTQQQLLLPIKLAIFLALLMRPLTTTALVLARLHAAGTATTVSLGLSTRPSFCETASTWQIICLTTGTYVHHHTTMQNGQ